MPLPTVVCQVNVQIRQILEQLEVAFRFSRLFGSMLNRDLGAREAQRWDGWEQLAEVPLSEVRRSDDYRTSSLNNFEASNVVFTWIHAVLTIENAESDGPRSRLLCEPEQLIDGAEVSKEAVRDGVVL